MQLLIKYLNFSYEMATYLVKKPIKIRRQAGDDCDVVFNVPDVFQVAGTAWSFVVFEKAQPNKVLFVKDGVAITTSGQRVEILISRNDTRNRHGLYDWELMATKDGKEITAGMGEFDLIKTRKV